MTTEQQHVSSVDTPPRRRRSAARGTGEGDEMATKQRKGPLMRIAPDPLEDIAARHTPTMIESGTDDADVVGVLICSRDEEIWPCDARQLRDRLGVARPSGARRGRLDYTSPIDG